MYVLLDSGSIAAGDTVDFCVPTGNFGDILAGWYAKQMGLPVGRLICASNRNNVLADFLTLGSYDAARDFHRTTSPSMDILVSSNLERCYNCFIFVVLNLNHIIFVYEDFHETI